MKKINLSEKFGLFNEYWSPKLVGELNGQYIKLAKFKGEMVCEVTGKFGYAVRVLPKHPDLSSHNMPGFIHWSAN